MLVLGLDIASVTGYAFSKGRDANDIASGVIKVPKDLVHPAKAYHLSQSIVRLIKTHGKPDYCVLEAPVGNTPNAVTFGLLHRLQGSAIGALAGFGVRCKEIPVQTWRNQMYGFGRQKGWSSKDWKTHAIKQCEYMSLQIASHDEAEAIMLSQLALAEWKKINLIGDVDPEKAVKKTRQKQHVMEGL